MKKFYLITALASISCFSISCKDTKAEKASQKASQEASSKYYDDLEKSREKLRKDFEKNGEMTDNTEHMDKLIDSADEFVDSSSGDTAKLARVNKAFLIKMRDVTTSMTANISNIVSASDLSKLKTVEDANKNIALIEEYLAENKKVKTFFSKGMRPFAIKLLDKENVSSSQKKEFLQGFDAAFKIKKPLLIEVREQDEIICTQLIKQNEILRDNLGKWSFDTELGMPTFEDDDTLEEFNKLAKIANEAALKQQAAQRKLLSQ